LIFLNGEWSSMAWWDEKAVENEEATPLDEETAKSFSDGDYKAVTLTEDVELYRVYGYKSREAAEAAQSESPPDYVYMTTEAPTDTMYSRTSSALKPEWGNRATHYERINIPAGTTVYTGQAEEQAISENDQALVGGADQVVISQNDFEPEMVTEKDIKLGYSSGYGAWEESIQKEIETMPKESTRESVTAKLNSMGHKHEDAETKRNENPESTREALQDMRNEQSNAEGEGE